MENCEVYSIVRRHLQDFFQGHACKEYQWMLVPAREEMPNLRVVEFAPGPRLNLWVYATVGAWESSTDHCLEFVLVAPKQDQRHVELMTMAAWYHKHEVLGKEHTFPIGQPWLPGSHCNCFLVSLPYPFGPELEICNLSDGHLHFFWLLPITTEEREFKAREGQEALEQKFDAAGLKYWNVRRKSVI